MQQADVTTTEDGATSIYSTKVSGDAENGWVVELHDGDAGTSHTCFAETEQEAVASAIADRDKMMPPGATASAADAALWDRMHQTFEKIDVAIAEIGDRATKLEEDRDTLRTAVGGLRTDLDALASMPDHAEALAKVHKRIDEIESLVTSPAPDTAAVAIA